LRPGTNNSGEKTTLSIKKTQKTQREVSEPNNLATPPPPGRARNAPGPPRPQATSIRWGNRCGESALVLEGKKRRNREGRGEGGPGVGRTRRGRVWNGGRFNHYGSKVLYKGGRVREKKVNLHRHTRCLEKTNGLERPGRGKGGEKGWTTRHVGGGKHVPGERCFWHGGPKNGGSRILLVKHCRRKGGKGKSVRGTQVL